MKLHGNRARLGGVLAAIAAALALVALPGLASGDSHHDALADAGTIESFDQETGVLTIDLTEGGSVSGLVTSHTHIHCDNGWHHGRRHHTRGGNASASQDRGGEGEDNHQSGEEEAGEEDGGQGVEPGEDSPGNDGTAPGRSEGPGQGDEHSARCTTGDLTVGTTVKFAELVLVDGKATYKAIVLPMPAHEGEEEAEAPSPE
jgi:hypothetical protein